MKMMKNKYSCIASYNGLREAIKENRKACDTTKACMEKHSIMLLKSLAPEALWNSFMQYVTPFKALYELFVKEKRQPDKT